MRNFIILLLLLVSCDRPTRLEQALELAKGNRQELEKVLDHYSNAEKDSLKYEAACFLIENMPGHYSYSGSEIEQYYSDILPVLTMDISLEEKYYLANSIYNKYIKYNNNYAQDIEIITAEYLIRNIDRAFKLWKEKKWLEHISFDYFCEYILPYKVTELQSLDNWQDTLYSKYSYLIESIPESQHDASIYIRTQAITDFLRTSKKEVNTFFASGESKQRSYNLLNASTIDKIPFGLCIDYVHYNVAVLRSLGMPAFIDNFPFWQYINAGHSWYSVINDNGKIISALNFTDSPGTLFASVQKYSKVFRKTYSHNPKVIKYLSETTYKHPSINIFQKDVTSEYTTTWSIHIPVNKKGLRDKYIYLTSFSGRNWNIIDFAKIRRGKVHFDQVTGGSVYIVMGYNGTNLIPISTPFIIHKSGRLEYVDADFQDRQEMKLYRKFPKKINTGRMESRVIGGEIQASNDENFSSFEIFYTFNDLLFPDTIKIMTDKKYRYWRFYSKENSYCNIAELQFFQKGKIDFAKNRIIGEKRMFHNNPDFSPEKAFDNKWNTYYMAPEDLEATNVWIGVDFGLSVIVDKVRCVPRSDDNGICAGNEYELMYWGNNKWESLGRKTAVDRVLDYKYVPNNTIYWLKNHTRGREEGVFTYKDGKQIWW